MSDNQDHWTEPRDARIAELEAIIAAITTALPETYYADRTFEERVAFTVNYWKRGVRAVRQVEERIVELEAANAALHQQLTTSLWSCPDCAFTFDVSHTNESDGGYSCPVCAEARLTKENKALRERVERLEAETVTLTIHKNNGYDMRDEAQHKLTSLHAACRPFVEVGRTLAGSDTVGVIRGDRGIPTGIISEISNLESWAALVVAFDGEKENDNVSM